MDLEAWPAHLEPDAEAHGPWVGLSIPLGLPWCCRDRDWNPSALLELGDPG